MSDIPRWDLTPAYSGFDSDQFKSNKELFRSGTETFKVHLENREMLAKDPVLWLTKSIEQFNTLGNLYEDLIAFSYCRFSTNTKDSEATKELGAIDELGIPFKDGIVTFRNALATIKKELPELIESNPELRKYSFFLTEELANQNHQMTPAEENLAADLNRAGGDAWSRLQEAISSNASEQWDEKEVKTVVQLRSLAFDADRSVREKAFRLELEAWKKNEIPLAFSLNGVKGFTHTLNERRKYESTLEKSVDQARITQKTLDALITAMEESLPMFREYFDAKANMLGLDKMAFYDLFAPIGGTGKVWSYNEAKEFILNQFGSFSDDLRDFAQKAFDQNWIDAEPREGKVGGAYCIGLPLTKSSRILANFDGSFSSLTTLAHELGHAYHGHILKDESSIHNEYPMTLAETASIFAENIVYGGGLKVTEGPEKAAILEDFLQGASQVVVDILSRFYFERDVMEKRKTGELSPEEFCQLMEKAQKATYGDGLDENELHPYMWAVKGHYYRPELSYYNFPYAFGLLFGLGLYARYQNEGSDFAPAYQEILAKTGKMSAVTLCKEAGFDIETPDFWRSGLAMVGEKIKEFKKLS